MPNTFDAYRRLTAVGLPEDQAAAYTMVLAEATTQHVLFDREAIVNRLCDAHFTENQAEDLANLAQTCFWCQRFSTTFAPVAAKTNLVRSRFGVTIAAAMVEATTSFVIVPKAGQVRHAVRYPPNVGHVLMCDFRFLRKPEMQKERRAIVISPRSMNRQRCVVVPVSMLAPEGAVPAHYHEFEPGSYRFFHQGNPVWALCDHLYTVSLERLWFINDERQRRMNAELRVADLQAVQEKVRLGLGLTQPRADTIISTLATGDREIDGKPI
ncbi:MAG TPA: type II toxin-antitoxin system PemK/MazF family toxin [Azospirillum sp.]|nr:type II toxin-antitoxin system PemK/MazF family toxin [Azospirillum sp.]